MMSSERQSNVGADAGIECSVVIVGAGPTGLMLAAELAIAGVDVVILERRTDQRVDGSRAGGLLPRSLEVLDQRGVVDRFLDAGYTVPAHGFAGIPLDLSDLPTRHNYILALRQSEFEPIVADWVVGDLQVRIVRGCEVVGLVQDDDGVQIELADGRSFRSSFVVGCDGGRSVVRNTAGIGFVGSDPTRSWIVAEVDTSDEPESGMRYDATGLHGISRVGEGGPVRAVLTERSLRTGDPTIDDLRDALFAVYDSDFGLHTVHWMSRFSDVTRQAVTYRDRRILVAGDAAHIHPPHGGQGLNTGLQDAVNLGWKLANVALGRNSDDLLDTYHDERHPVARRVLHNTLAQVALTSGGDQHQALRDHIAEILTVTEARHRIAAMLCGLDIQYAIDPSPDAHPLVGRRIPDIDLETADGPSRVFEHLHDAHPTLINFGAANATKVPASLHDVRVVEATRCGSWELPLLGRIDVPTAVLIRPDGHVAWAGDPGDPGLAQALFAAPARADRHHHPRPPLHHHRTHAPPQRPSTPQKEHRQ
ncbi:MAG: FAD-dependent monooxygenase [Ilumatobacteraceae bacterium]